MNGEQRGFIRFINQTQMASFGTFNSQVVWFFGSVALTLVDAWLLTRHAAEIPYSRITDPLAASAAVSLFMAHNTAAEQMRQVGLYLAGVLIFGWTGKSVTGFFSGKNVRETSREAMEGQAKIAEAKAKGEAPPIVQAQKVEKVEVKNGGGVRVIEGAGEEPQWAEGDPRAGVL